MSKHTLLLETLGVNDAEAAYQRAWGRNMPSATRTVEGRVTTLSRQEMVRRNRDSFEKNFRGFAATHIGLQIARNAGTQDAYVKALPDHMRAVVTGAGIGNPGSIGGNVANGVVPLVFDPDILQILKTEAPILEQIPEIGQQGFKAVVNRIDERGQELGFRSEADALDLTAEVENDDTFEQIEVDMEIWLDKVRVSDFARVAGQHYFDVRDTALGQRIAQHAQAKERNVLYGDPSQNTGTGGFGDAEGYDGYAQIITDAGNAVDKSAVDITGTDGLLRDIKAEIKQQLQSALAVSKGDLWLATSHTLFDELENELEVRRRINDDKTSALYGFEEIRISGVPVVASHNVREHTDAAATAGSEGDVFILNRREAQFRSLLPLSTVPLARVGLAEQVALAEFGAPILRGAGRLSRYLFNYAI